MLVLELKGDMRSHFWRLNLPAGIGYATVRARGSLGLGLRDAIAFQNQLINHRVTYNRYSKNLKL
ncbi:MAG TPA: hypothetical protein V6C85_25065 [Allocoleopsis sp.]